MIWYGRDTARFLARHWFITVYVLLAIAQPMISHEITGNNFQRLAMQGVWLVYLAMALATTRRPAPVAERWMLAAYALTIFAQPQPRVQLVAAIVMLAACAVATSFPFDSRSSDLP
jgi:hypothetical protein